MTVICFHKPEEENGYLSNWYLSDFEINGVKFSSMEQYMMYSKAIAFHDEEAGEKILSSTSAARIKALGRQVRNYDDHYWNGIRQIVIYEGLLAKFSQNEELKQKLLDTGNACLCECALGDKIWGTGISMKDGNRFDPGKWKGQNLLGYALMMVREKLR